MTPIPPCHTAATHETYASQPQALSYDMSHITHLDASLLMAAMAHKTLCCSFTSLIGLCFWFRPCHIVHSVASLFLAGMVPKTWCSEDLLCPWLLLMALLHHTGLTPLPRPIQGPWKRPRPKQGPHVHSVCTMLTPCQAACTCHS